MEEQSKLQTGSSLPSFSDLLSEAWNSFMDRWQLYVSLMAIPAVLQIVLYFMYPESTSTDFYGVTGWQTTTYADSLGAGEIVLTLLFVLVSLIAQVALLYAIVRRTETLDFMKAFQGGLKKFGPYLWVSILTGLAVIVGFALLIIPGIIFLIWFAFATYIVMKEDLGGVAAMKRSKELVQGYWWPIFGRFLGVMIVVAIVSGVLGLIPIVGTLVTSIVITPVAVLFMILIYEHRLKNFGK